MHVSKAETERVLATPPATWQAYEHYLRATHTLALYESSLDRDELLKGRRELSHVLAVDPDYARAHASLARSYLSLWVHRWNDDCPWTAALDRAHQFAREAVRLAPNLPIAHAALGFALSWMRQHEAAIATFERAIELNPNLNDPDFAWILLLAGEPERAIQVLEQHMRLDPFYLPQAPWWLGSACYMVKRYADAVRHLQEAVSRAPSQAIIHRWLGAAYAQLGQLDKAKAEAAEAQRIEPWFTIGQAHFALACKRPEDAEHFRDGLRTAGFPE